MFSLWKKSELLTINQKPSPKRQRLFLLHFFIKRASRFLLFHYEAEGSMTVEAAIILPLFLAFFVNLGSAIEMIRLHGNLELALWNVGNKMCLYGYMTDFENQGSIPEEGRGTKEGSIKELEDVILSYTYVKSEISNFLGEEYLAEAPLKGGIKGLSFLESEIDYSEEIGEDHLIKLTVTYEVSPWFAIPYVRPFRMSNCYYGRMWTGYDLSQPPDSEEDSLDVVYITEKGQVYHENIECTHLKLSIREIPITQLPFSHNEQGESYSACSLCRGREPGFTVYITREGKAYHYDASCSGLKRTIYTIKRSEAAGYRPCSRCSGK